MCFLHHYRTHADAVRSATGSKGSYSLMKHPFHDPIKQTVPDAMHVIQDVAEHILKLITGTDDTMKVRKCEMDLKRFGILSTKISKQASGSADVPYILSHADIGLANVRASNICVPLHIDFIPGHFFSKSSKLKSHDYKQVFDMYVLDV